MCVCVYCSLLCWCLMLWTTCSVSFSNISSNLSMCRHTDTHRGEQLEQAWEKWIKIRGNVEKKIKWVEEKAQSEERGKERKEEGNPGRMGGSRRGKTQTFLSFFFIWYFICHCFCEEVFETMPCSQTCNFVKTNMCHLLRKLSNVWVWFCCKHPAAHLNWPWY